ncbi:MAG: hypothetical protein J5489_00120 [Lachnospiraceae bacterium]|nr:hypothetical protein [Lachnospiraceae bacterium]
MTDLGQLIEDEKQEAIKEAVNKVTKEKDAQLAQKDAEIMDLKAQLEALKKAPKA